MDTKCYFIVGLKGTINISNIYHLSYNLPDLIKVLIPIYCKKPSQCIVTDQICSFGRFPKPVYFPLRPVSAYCVLISDINWYMYELVLN